MWHYIASKLGFLQGCINGLGMEAQMEHEIETAGCVRIPSSLQFRPCSQERRNGQENGNYQIRIGDHTILGTFFGPPLPV